MKATEYLGDREHLYSLLNEMTEQQWDKVLDMLRVIAYAKLPDSKLKAAEELRGILWQTAEKAEEDDMYKEQTLEQIYGLAPCRLHFPSCEV